MTYHYTMICCKELRAFLRGESVGLDRASHILKATMRKPKRRRDPRLAQWAALVVVALLAVGLVGAGKVATMRSPSSMFEAINRGDDGAVRWLLAIGADPNKASYDGLTPLELAVARGRTEIARMLIGRGAQVNTAEGVTSALHRATLLGRADEIELLLAHGANLEAVDEQGNTALHLASRGQSDAPSAALIRAGANIEAVSGSGLRPLHLACVRNSESVARLLVAHGADLEARDEEGRTPLHHAVIAGAIAAGRVVLEAGANPNARAQRGHRPLDIALMGNSALTVDLLRYGAELPPPDRQGYTALHYAAASMWDEGAVRAIAERIAPNVRSHRNETPLHVAAANGNRNAIRALLESGADPNAVNADGDTPLHLLAGMVLPVTAEILIQGGANVEARDRRGHTVRQIVEAIVEDVPPTPGPLRRGPLQFQSNVDERKTQFMSLLERTKRQRR